MCPSGIHPCGKLPALRISRAFRQKPSGARTRRAGCFHHLCRQTRTPGIPGGCRRGKTSTPRTVPGKRSRCPPAVIPPLSTRNFTPHSCRHNRLHPPCKRDRPEPVNFSIQSSPTTGIFFPHSFRKTHRHPSGESVEKLHRHAVHQSRQGLDGRKTNPC